VPKSNYYGPLIRRVMARNVERKTHCGDIIGIPRISRGHVVLLPQRVGVIVRIGMGSGLVLLFVAPCL